MNKYIRVIFLSSIIFMSLQVSADVIYSNEHLKFIEFVGTGNDEINTALSLGYIYGNAGSANGGDQDRAAAMYLKAAKKGEPNAMYQLYVLFSSKNMMNREIYKVEDSDSKKIALKWLIKSADANYSLAQYEQGRLYDSGELIHQNKWLAKVWLKRSAENGYLPAKDMLKDII